MKILLNSNQNKKQYSKTAKTIKIAFEWIFNIICFALVILALLMAIASISRTKDIKKGIIGIATLGNLTYAPVATNSMEPEINIGDLVVGHKYAGQELSEEDIITFRTIINGEKVLNTHRIVEVVYSSNEDKTIKYYRTKGDNSPDIDSRPVLPSDIVSVYTTNYKGMGKPIIWLQSDPQHFFLGVVLPIILLFVIYAAIFIRALINAALGKKRLAAATVDGLSEEDKKKLAEEYLAKLEAEKHQQADDVVATSNDIAKQGDTQIVTVTNKDDVAYNNAPVQDDSQKQDDTNAQDSVVDNNEDSKTAEDSGSNK